MDQHLESYLEAMERRLETHTEARLDEVIVHTDQQMARADERLSRVEDRLAGVEDRLAGVDERLSRVDERLAGVDERLAGVDDRLAQMDDQLGRMGDQLIQTNGRLSTLESRFEHFGRGLELRFEQLSHDVRGAVSDALKMHADRLDDHDERIGRLEKRVLEP